MDYNLKEVAQRIKELREAKGYTPAELAKLTDVSLDDYLVLEQGETDFSFTFIYKCAKVCNVEVIDILEGTSSTLTSYAVTRKGEGAKIVRKKGFVYNNLAPKFKNKLAEPFLVEAPFIAEEQTAPIKLSSHKGQEIDIIVSGTLKVQVGSHIEVLNEGDSIFYDSSTPHGMIAVEGQDTVFYAIVLNGAETEQAEKGVMKSKYKPHQEYRRVYHDFIDTTEDENGALVSIDFKNEDKFNFAFDVVDEIARRKPDKLAMLYVSKDHKEKRFTFTDFMKESSRCANYFESLGIKKGDKVMMVLKRHYQFWIATLALQKIGAVSIPASFLLQEHDYEYRYEAAGVSAILCTADDDIADRAEAGSKNATTLREKIIVGGSKDGWRNFDEEYKAFPDVYERKADSPCGDDDMLLYFTSGTTGNPKMALHSFKYPLGHFHTANYWHCVDPEGLHLTISDTGWAKAAWGKIYGQWLCEAALFVYDFDKFDAADILPMFAKYKITTFCAPPTMYRMLMKEDISKYDMSSVQHATTAGEALNPEVFKQIEKLTGLKIMEGFGQTETTCLIGNLYGREYKMGAMGKPVPLYDVDIVDPNGNSVGVGENGEIVIRTDKRVPCGLFKGYYRDEEKTAEVWHDGLYHTGDVAYKDEDGFYFYVSRIDDVIKSSGYRIGPFEIESVIMELPYVLECGVSAEPDEVRGQVVKASIVLTKDTTPSEELKKEIQNYVKKNTAPYKYPRIVVFRDELPKTISGKIQRHKL